MTQIGASIPDAATDAFAGALSRLRVGDRFSVGRRILSLIALGALQPKDGQDGWRLLRLAAQERPGSEWRNRLSGLAKVAGEPRSGLRSVFDILINDALHSRSFHETATIASLVLGEIGRDADEAAFGRWFSARLGDVLSSGPVAGELMTSNPMSDLMVALARPAEDGVIYDPCCGFGNLLAAAHARSPKAQIVGEESHPISWAFAKLRFNLLGAKADILLGDAFDLQDSRLIATTVLCDPPLGAYGYHSPAPRLAQAASRGAPSKRSETLFVDLCLNRLAPNGRAAILVSQSFLTRRGLEERLRALLARRGLLQAVISLPAAISTSNNELAMLILGDPALTSPSVRMIDAARMGIRSRAKLDEANIALLTKALDQDADPRFSRDQPRAELADGRPYRLSLLFEEDRVRRTVPDLLEEAQMLDGLALEEGRRIADVLQRLRSRDYSAL